MSRNNSKYRKTLKEQIYDVLCQMLKNGVGTSKKEAKINGTDQDKIFSFSTYQSYFKHCKYFADYINETHPECTTLKSAKKYLNEWLAERTAQVDKNGKKLSTYTLFLERQALTKLYGITPDDPNFFPLPNRNRVEITRSRGDAIRDKHFSEKNNDELIKFCRGTGCRRNILEKLKGRDLFTYDDLVELAKADHSPAISDALTYFPENEYFIKHENDKGGRDRYSPIIGPNTEKIVERMKSTPPESKVWSWVPGGADIHSYRADYATSIYKAHAREIEEIPRSEIYTCRKDERGKKLDRTAMLIASKALGHNRIEVVARHYLRGI